MFIPVQTDALSIVYVHTLWVYEVLSDMGSSTLLCKYDLLYVVIAVMKYRFNTSIKYACLIGQKCFYQLLLSKNLLSCKSEPFAGLRFSSRHSEMAFQSVRFIQQAAWLVILGSWLDRDTVFR